HLQARVKGPVDDGGGEALGEDHTGYESCVTHRVPPPETIGQGGGQSNQGDVNVVVVAADVIASGSSARGGLRSHRRTRYTRGSRARADTRSSTARAPR